MHPPAILEAVRRVVDEFDALQSIYGLDFSTDSDALSELRRISTTTSDPSSAARSRQAPEHSSTARTSEFTPVLKELPDVKLRLNDTTTLRALLPVRYLLDPDAVPLVWLDHGERSRDKASSPGTIVAQKDVLDAALQAFVYEQSASRDEPVEMLLEIAQHATDLLHDQEQLRQVEAATDFDDDDADSSSVVFDNFFGNTEVTSTGQTITKAKKLGRRLMYSHHIRAPGKRRAIIECARQLNLSGFSKIGYPGVVLIEGEEDACDAYVNAIQRLRWKYFAVRGEEIVEADDECLATGTINSLRKLPLGLFHEFGPDEMNLLAAECRKYDLEDLFKTCMKIYR
ncbi:unnamed protein product [Amoebophrya sp. A120]|nr:unnamed protein product [Amoebophrya sp. A120]|eukprot:GSA120T00017681001.1